MSEGGAVRAVQLSFSAVFGGMFVALTCAS